MNTTLAIQITEEDKAESRRLNGYGDSHHCPAALAVKRAIRNRGIIPDNITTCDNVSVNSNKPLTGFGGAYHILSLDNPALYQWQLAWDRRKDPAPAEFLIFME